MHKIGTRVTVKALAHDTAIGTVIGHGHYDVQAHADANHADRPLDSDIEPCYLIALDQGSFIGVGTSEVYVSTIVAHHDHVIAADEACQHAVTRNACGLRDCYSGCAVFCADCGTLVRAVTAARPYGSHK